MAIFGGLFGKEKPAAASPSANLDRLTQAIRSRLGLRLLPPPPEAVARLAAMKTRELVQFENMQSPAGLESLLHALSLHGQIDPAAQTVTLSAAAPASDETAAAPAPAAPREPIRVGLRPAAVHVSQPVAPADALKPAGTAAAAAKPAAVAAPLPAGLENVEGLERLTVLIVDAFVKQGRLTTGDKDVLKNIRPTDGTPAARLIALERWQQEIIRRTRGLILPRTQQQFALATVVADPHEKPEAAMLRRLDALIGWTAKLIRAFEQTGVRFQNKPVWLPQH